jgi:MYXO-CTERM domain-containing protein
MSTQLMHTILWVLAGAALVMLLARRRKRKTVR